MSGKAVALGAQSDDPPRLSLDNHLPHALGAAAISVGRLIARAYEGRFGLSVIEWRLMALLAEIGPAPGAVVFARAASDGPVAQHAVQALIDRDFAGGDGGALALTAEGRRVYEAIAPLALAWEAALLTGFTPGEVTALRHLLKRLAAAAERLGGEAI